MNEKKLSKIRKNNMKLYPIYKMIGLDWIFYYGIEVLFLTRSKTNRTSRYCYGFFFLFIILPNISNT